MPLANLHDLFEHELKDIYDAESRLIDALRDQALESTDPKVRAGFQEHRQQTIRHKERLERVFDAWGKQPNRGPGCEGVQGLLEEHRAFKRAGPSPPILDLFNLSAATKVERYEICAYESLLLLAEQMGFDDAIPLLQKTLEEEEATLEKVQTLLERPLDAGATRSASRGGDRPRAVRARRG